MEKKTIITLLVGTVVVILGVILYLTLNNQSISKTPTNNQTPQNINQSEVTIKDLSFSPESLTIKAGSNVTFTNKDTVKHTIVESNKAFDKEIGPGDTLKITFDKTGTYQYACSLHPSMKGMVIVQ